MLHNTRTLSNPRLKFLTLILIVFFLAVSSSYLSANPSASTIEGTQRKTISIEPYRNLLILRTTINRSQPYDFLLNIGASVSLLNEKVAAALDLKVNRLNQVIEGTGESKVKIGMTHDITLGKDGIDLIAKNAAVVPFESLESIFGRHIGGVIGANLFKRYVVEIDYSGRKIYLYEPEGYTYHGDGQVIPIKLHGDRPFIKGKVNIEGAGQIEGSFVIDSGDDGAVGFHTPFVNKHHLLSANLKTIKHTTHGIAGDASELIGRVDTFEIGRFTIVNPIATFATSTKGSTADASYDGPVGGQILRKFKVIFDYRHEQLILEPNEELNSVFEFDMSGLSLAAEEPDFKIIKIINVLEGSPGATAELQSGDVILSVNDRSAGLLGLEPIRQLFKKGETEYQLGIERNGQELRLRLKTKRLV